MSVYKVNSKIVQPLERSKTLVNHALVHPRRLTADSFAGIVTRYISGLLSQTIHRICSVAYESCVRHA